MNEEKLAGKLSLTSINWSLSFPCIFVVIKKYPKAPRHKSKHRTLHASFIVLYVDAITLVISTTKIYLLASSVEQKHLYIVQACMVGVVI